MRNKPIAVGEVRSLAINGKPVGSVLFYLQGPEGDSHVGLTRQLSGHDSEYISTSVLKKGSTVFNTRTWTALSTEEVGEMESILDCKIPVGCLLENITIAGISNFSQLEPTSRLVFSPRGAVATQAILAVWEENGPCETVGARLEELYGTPRLKTEFVKAAQHRRGLMGFVYAAGRVAVGDEVRVYPPVR